MGESAPSSALARLLEREAQLEAMLGGARERAAAIIANAEHEAEAGAAALEAELAAAAARAEASRSADCAARLAALSRQSEVALARLRDIGPAQLTGLAHWVAGQVLEGSAGAEP